MSEQRPPPLTPHQPSQLQQQTIALTTPMMPTQAFYVSSDNNASLQHTATVPPMGYIIAVQNPTVAETYLSRQSVGLGIVLTILGVLTIIFNGVGFAVGDSFAVIGHGFWSGVLFIVTGVFGIVAAKKTKSLIVTFMVFSIISALATGALMGLGILGSILNAYSECNPDYGDSSCNMDAAIAMEALLATLAVFAAVVSIWGSVICCRAVCCCAPAHNSVNPAAFGNQQISFVNQQQQPAGAVQYGIPQMTPMTFAVPSPAYPPQSAYLRPQPPQYWTNGPLTQLGQQQQYYALNSQQPYGFAFVASSNVDRMPETVAVHPSSVNDPPAYDSSNNTKGTSS